MTKKSLSIDPIVEEVRVSASAVELDLLLPDDLMYLQGHFPGCPVLPGVTQIDWAVRLGDEYLGAGIGAAQDFQVKFRSIIQPGVKLTLFLRMSDENTHLHFEYRGQEKLLSSGAIRLDHAP